MFCGAVPLLGLGRFIGVWTFSLLIPLILSAVVCGVSRDLKALNRLKAAEELAESGSLVGGV